MTDNSSNFEAHKMRSSVFAPSIRVGLLYVPITRVLWKKRVCHQPHLLIQHSSLKNKSLWFWRNSLLPNVTTTEVFYLSVITLQDHCTNEKHLIVAVLDERWELFANSWAHTEQGFFFPCGRYCWRMCSSVHIPYCIELRKWRSQNWRMDTSRGLSFILHSFVDSSGFMYALLLRGLVWNRCIKLPTIFFSDMNWRVGYRDGKTLDLYRGAQF